MIGCFRGICAAVQGLDALDPEERLDIAPEFVGASAPRHPQGPYRCAAVPLTIVQKAAFHTDAHPVGHSIEMKMLLTSMPALLNSPIEVLTWWMSGFYSAIRCHQSRCVHAQPSRRAGDQEWAHVTRQCAAAAAAAAVGCQLYLFLREG